MNFSEFALALKPYLASSNKNAEYFSELISAYIKDSAVYSCHALDKKPDTLSRYVNGNPIPKTDADFFYKNRDENKFSNWLTDRLDETDSYEIVSQWLEEIGVSTGYTEDDVTSLLTSIFLDISRGTEAEKKTTSPFESSLNLIKELNSKIAQLPKPVSIPVPTNIDDSETAYINALYEAYGDELNIPSFSESDLQNSIEFKDDLDDRRIDYYAAISIERSVAELEADNLNNQFEVLKDETLNGVKDKTRMSYPSGYVRMLEVMNQAVNLSVPNYLLSESPYWISGRIKKGVCHCLVNDGKLRWVKKK